MNVTILGTRPESECICEEWKREPRVRQEEGKRAGSDAGLAEENARDEVFGERRSADYPERDSGVEGRAAERKRNFSATKVG